MKNFIILNLLLLLAGTIQSCSGLSREKLNEKPNVVIIFIDDMGYADPSCFGNPIMKTPNIDKLADNGIKFTNFYVNSPICSPSRVAINTGKYPMRYKIHSYINWSYNNKKRAMADFLDPKAPTIARTLQKNGYATAHFGKWHMGGGRDLSYAPLPSKYGFDKTLVSHAGWGDRLLPKGSTVYQGGADSATAKTVYCEKYETTRVFVDSALTFINRHKSQPFYVNLFPLDVHDPHNAAPGMQDKYSSVTDNPFQQKFLAVLEETDKQIGRFVDGLDNMGLLENTIIIFTSDNGPTDWPRYYKENKYPEGYQGELYPPGFTGEFFGRKWSLYEGGIRMPFIIHWKGHIPAGKTDDQTIVAATDLFPSLCAIAGVKWPDDLDGKDKSQALLGTPMDVTDPIMWEYNSNPGGTIIPGNPDFISPNLAMREGKWKLLINADSTDAQLFDLDLDPNETNNLVKREPELVNDMASRLIAWRQSMPVAIKKDKK
jgi:arylsulfatase A-like enzyme